MKRKAEDGDLDQIHAQSTGKNVHSIRENSQKARVLVLGATSMVLTRHTEQTNEDPETSGSQEAGTSSGAVTQKQVAVPRQPVLQNAGYSGKGGVQVGKVKEPCWQFSLRISL